MIRLRPSFRLRSVPATASRRHQRAAAESLKRALATLASNSRRINGDGTQIATLRLSAHGECSCRSLELTQSVLMALHHMAEWRRFYFYFFQITFDSMAK